MLLAKNRKALYNYEIIEKYLAGLVLRGYEVKAIKERHVSFEGAYIKFMGDAPFIVNLQIGKYSKQAQAITPEDETRPRKLLLHKKEMESLKRQIDEKGKTAVPLALLLHNNLIKLELAIVKGRKKYEKKAVAKARQIEKDLQIQRKKLGLRG